MKLYIAAEEYKIPALMNAVIDSLCNIWSISTTPLDVVSFAFEKTSATAPLRPLLIKMLRWECNGQDLKELKNILSNKIFYELITEILSFGDGEDPTKQLCQRFHQHTGKKRGKFVFADEIH